VADETGMKSPTLFTTMYMHAAPQDAVPASMCRTGAIGHFWDHRTRAMPDPGNAFRRIFLPRTPENRGKSEGWSVTLRPSSYSVSTLGNSVLHLQTRLRLRSLP